MKIHNDIYQKEDLLPYSHAKLAVYWAIILEVSGTLIPRVEVNNEWITINLIKNCK